MKLFLKLWNCFFCWRLKTTLLTGNEQAVVAQDFGMGADGIPCKSNKALSEIVKTIREIRPDIYVIAQKEIANCFDTMPSASKIYKHRTPGKYLDTREVLVQAEKICKFNNWRKIIIVAHPDHYWRVMMTAVRLGFEVCIISTKQVPYDPESTQPWTRSKTRFISREIFARLYYLLRDWI